MPALTDGNKVTSIHVCNGGPAQLKSIPDCAVRASHKTRTAVRLASWDERSGRWRCLMVAGRAGDSQAYDRLLRELDIWLRLYFERRLPFAAAEDARQDALLAIHAKRHTYKASRSFGAWLYAIARHKWIDRVRDASRFIPISLDDEVSVEDHERAAISAAALDHLLGRLSPAQAKAIRLVKLNGLSIARASGATGQSAALIKVNIHRGLRRLAALLA